MMAQSMEDYGDLRKMTEEEERAVWREFAESRAPEPHDRLVEHYFPLLVATAERATTRLPIPACIPAQDIVSWGSYGLMDAVERFDPSLGIPFSAYCRNRILGAIRNEIRRLGWPFRGPRAKEEGSGRGPDRRGG